MSNASLRKNRVAIYSYGSVTDTASGVTSSVYTRVLSPAADGLWFASRGTVFGRETAPGRQPQSEVTSLWSFEAGVPITPDGVIATGTVAAGVFTRNEVFRIQSVMPRAQFRGQVQAFVTLVDDATVTFSLQG